MGEHKINSIVSFISGDLFVTAMSFAGVNIWDESLHFAIKAVITLALGFLGGLGGLIVKDVYPHIVKGSKSIWAKLLTFLIEHL